MKVIGESLERPDRFRVAIRANGRDMHGGTDVDRGRGGMNRGQTRSRTGTFWLRHAFYPLRENDSEGLGRGERSIS
jgi:hypothetical protein